MEKNSQTKNRKRRKLLIALLMMLLTGVVLSTGTYAWFTANKTVTINDITVNVAASNGLQISIDGINFKTVVSNEDITGARTTYPGAVNQLPASTKSLVPVSTVGEIDTSTGFIKMFKGTVQGTADGNIVTTEQSVETHTTDSGDFIAFDVFLQVNKETTIYLTSNSNVKVPEGKDSTGIENAARVAFVYEGYSPAGTASTAIQALKASSATYATPSHQTEASFRVWEPNYDVHTAAGITQATTVYKEAVYGTGKKVTATGGDQLEYYGVKAPITAAAKVPVDSTNTTYFQKVTPAISTVKAGISENAYEQLMTLNAGINKVRIYMWVEGQDVDCENNASGGSLVYSLQFSILTNVNDTTSE